MLSKTFSNVIGKNLDQKHISRASLLIFFFNYDSLHARLNSHYNAWSYKKKKHKKITA